MPKSIGTSSANLLSTVHAFPHNSTYLAGRFTVTTKVTTANVMTIGKGHALPFGHDAVATAMVKENIHLQDQPSSFGVKAVGAICMWHIGILPVITLETAGKK